MTPDFAKAVKNGLETRWATEHPTWEATLEVDDDFKPTAGRPVLLVADDGGPSVLRDPWISTSTPKRPTLRITGFAAGRTEALTVVNTGAAFVIAEKPGIARIEDISTPLVTRDRETGAYLASITMPVIVRQTA